MTTSCLLQWSAEGHGLIEIMLIHSDGSYTNVNLPTRVHQPRSGHTCMGSEARVDRRLRKGMYISPLQKRTHSTEHLKLAFASDILFPMACSLTKASQCLSYLRLFPGRTNEIFCHTIILFITTYTVVCIFIALLQCRPIRAHWNPQTGVECIHMRATLTAMAALNSFSDLMIYL